MPSCLFNLQFANFFWLAFYELDFWPGHTLQKADYWASLHYCWSWLLANLLKCAHWKCITTIIIITTAASAKIGHRFLLDYQYHFFVVPPTKFHLDCQIRNQTKKEGAHDLTSFPKVDLFSILFCSFLKNVSLHYYFPFPFLSQSVCLSVFIAGPMINRLIWLLLLLLLRLSKGIRKQVTSFVGFDASSLSAAGNVCSTEMRQAIS